MKSDNYAGLDIFKLDVLQEVGNIGAGNAATALSKMLNAKINVTIPNVRILKFDEISEALGGSEIIAMGVSIDLIDDMHGRLLQIIQKSFVEKILNAFYHKQVEDLRHLDEMDQSVISEVGNITTAAYANALSVLSGMRINITPPKQFTDEVGKLLHIPSAEIDEYGGKVLFIDVNFSIEEQEFKSNMILELDLKSLTYLFSNLGVN